MAASVTADRSGALVRDHQSDPRYRLFAPGTLLGWEQPGPDQIRLSLKL